MNGACGIDDLIGRLREEERVCDSKIKMLLSTKVGVERKGGAVYVARDF